jgi:hypothetical protein
MFPAQRVERLDYSHEYLPFPYYVSKTDHSHLACALPLHVTLATFNVQWEPAYTTHVV